MEARGLRSGLKARGNRTSGALGSLGVEKVGYDVRGRRTGRKNTLLETDIYAGTRWSTVGQLYPNSTLGSCQAGVLPYTA